MHRTFVPGPLLLRSGADARPLAGEYGFHWNLCCHWLKGLLRRPVAVIRQDPGIHYNDVMMSTMASQMTSLVIVYSTVYSRSRSKKISKLRVTDLCAGNSPVTGEFPAQTASNAEVFPFDDVIMTCASLHIHTSTTSLRWRHNDPIASQITSLTVVYSVVYSGAHQRNIKAPRHWPLCGEFTGTGEFPAQRASYAENVSIWWRHHVMRLL